MAVSSFSSAAERTQQGVRLGLAGLSANGLLCAGKCLLGWSSGSAAILADGFNNLADAASSAVTLLAFGLSAKPADEVHPLLLTGWLVPFLLVSIVIKLLLALYSQRCGRRLASPAVQTYAADSLIDALTTALVLVGVFMSAYTSWPIDALVGLGMAGLILITGVKALKANLSPLLGQGPDEALQSSVAAVVQEVPGLFGYHQLEIHDYGPSKRSISLHVCCADTLTLIEAHALETLLQTKLAEALHVDATIHLDPQTLIEGESPDVSLPGRLLKDHFDHSKAAWLRALCGYRRKALRHQAQRFPGGAPFGIPRADRFRQPPPYQAHPRRPDSGR